MPKTAKAKYHNLEGVCNDIKRALDNEDWEVLERYLDFHERVVAELTESVEADDVEADDDSDDAPDGNQGDVACEGRQSRPEGGGVTGGPVPRRRGDGAPASVLDGLLDMLPGDQRAAAVAELDKLRRDSVGAPGTRVRTC